MKSCAKCGNDKLIEGVRFCLKCGADVDTANNTKECYTNDCTCKENDNKRIVKTRLSVELFEII